MNSNGLSIIKYVDSDHMSSVALYFSLFASGPIYVPSFVFA